MRFTIKDKPSDVQNLDGVVVFVFENMSYEGLNSSIAKKLVDIRSRNVFQGKSGEVYTTFIDSGRSKKILKLYFFQVLVKKRMLVQNKFDYLVGW